METELIVKGMTCNHCVMSVKGALKGLRGVDSVDVTLASGKVVVQYSGEQNRIPEFKAAIEEQGYEVQ